MELNNTDSHILENEDKLSSLSDDILLYILGTVDIHTAARTSVLSTRWKHVPWLLHELTIDAKGFLSVTHQNPVEVEHMDKAMASLTEAVRSFLDNPWSKSTIIARLQLRLYLVNNYSDVIGPLVCEAINIGTIKDLDLAIIDEKEADDCFDVEMVQQACLIDGFFSAYPSLFHCLTRLSLYNVCFAEWDMRHLLFDCCKQLQHLYLFNCDDGRFSAWKINAPNSKLSVLELHFCLLGKLDVTCLPKLERLCWKTWICPKAPLSLDGVPSLQDLDLVCPATVDHQGFDFSEVLSDTTAINNLSLNFLGEKIWIYPEGKQLSTAFNKLRKLSLHGIFVQFDLLWTIVLLEAAPSVEMFDIEICEHLCAVATEEKRRTFGERTNFPWKASEFKSHKEWLLKEVQVTGFSPVEHQITFLMVVIGRAPNLQTVQLNDYHHCEDCDEIGAPPRSERLSPQYTYPEDKGEQDMVMEQLIGDLPSCNVQIVFGK